MIGVIPAAGKGTRIGNFCERYPKAIIPFKGKPIIIYNIESLLFAGCKKVVIVVNYRSSYIRAAVKHFLSKEKASKCEFVYQEKLNGTAMAVKIALLNTVNKDHLHEYRDQEVLMIFGDLIFSGHSFINDYFKKKLYGERHNFVSGQVVQDYERWVMIKANPMYFVESYINKPKERPDTNIAWSGIFYVRSAMDLLFDMINYMPTDSFLKKEMCISDILKMGGKTKVLFPSILDFGTYEDCVKLIDIEEAISFTEEWVEQSITDNS